MPATNAVMPSLSHPHPLGRSRLFPSTRPAPTCTPLSILDATVARFASTSAVWVYEETLATGTLAQALQAVVDLYPQWTGRLRFADLDLDAGDHTKRLGRLELAWGDESDPGVELIVAHSISPLAGRFPGPADREAGVWDAAAGIPAAEILHPETPLALHSMKRDEPNLPCVYAQVTTFEGGGTAVAVKLAHSLSDARSMNDFVRTWSDTYIAIVGNSPLPPSGALFDPAALDRVAAGDLDAPAASPAILASAHVLPVAWYDWWASRLDAHSWAGQATAIPPDAVGDPGSLGRSMPWKAWDLSRPASQKLLFFTGAEVHAMWQSAIKDDPITAGNASDRRLSHLDTLLAHVWSLVCRARRTSATAEATSRLYYTLDARSRVEPPLSPAFIGSPIFLAEVATPTSKLLATDSLAPLARQFRATLAAFTPVTVPAYLHKLGHAQSSQRYWSAFLGDGHGIFTSWVRQSVYSIGFGTRLGPVDVSAIMPCMDGILQISELGDGRDPEKDWWDSGVSVSISLDSEALERLIADDTLRRFRPAAASRSQVA